MTNKPLTINGKTLAPKELLETGRRIIIDPSQPEWLQDFYDFVLDWMNEQNTIKVQTSGTTGPPKTISFSKETMKQSARKTLAFFDLDPGDSVVLCLSAQYIAGKMMIVRAMEGGLNLILQEPSSDPWQSIEEQIDFIPVVPVQLQKLLHQPEKQKRIKTILAGGAPIDYKLERKLQKISPVIFHSYGMTETVTHVALRRINGEESSDFYRALDGVTFSVDDQQRLIVEMDFLDRAIQTNDVVNLLDEKRFIWHGRMDTVINSGGIKVFPEVVEKKLAKLIYRRFFIIGISDEALGEKIILIIEGEPMEESCLEALKNRIDRAVEKYEAPKEIYFYDDFPETRSGKVKRKEVVENLIH
ncbi:MAG: AMP-binding protein [Bacteroidales bacterium]|nr:AMP-binding protein [Bacteroidales bacterium]